MNIKAKRTDPRFHLRLPKLVLKAVDKAANSSGRSRNTEILMRLATSLGLAKDDAVKSTGSNA